MIYFGYGSNLSEADLEAWCRARRLDPIGLVPIGPAYLPDRRLAFTHRSTTRLGGVLDVPEAKGGAVAGVLFRVPSASTWASLDRKEGEGHAYKRFAAIALTDDGSEVPVVAYEVLPGRREPFVRPAPEYLDVLRRGYEAHGIEPGQLDAASRGELHPGPVSSLFVYGTLRRGEERHAVLERHHASGGVAATTSGTLLDLGPYPGLVLDRGSTPITGELYDVSDPASLFRELDGVETFRGFGAPGSLYRRAIVRATLADERRMPVWTYVYVGTRNGCHEVVSGDWKTAHRP